MAVKLSSLRANTEKEETGDWVDIPDLGGLRLKVRSLHTVAYRNARDLVLQRLMRRHGRAVPPEELAKANGQLYLDHVLVDWEGFVDDNDNPIPFTKEEAAKMLLDPAYRLFHDAVEYAAAEVGRIDVDYVDAIVKN